MSMCTCCNEDLDSECGPTESEVRHTIREKSVMKQGPPITRFDSGRLKGDKLFQKEEPSSALHKPGANLKQ